MSDIFSDLRICRKIPEVFEKSIKLFHVFHDINKYENILFVTHEDRVFSMGPNFLGICGVGGTRYLDRSIHRYIDTSSYIADNSPQELIELKDKNIQEFIVGGNLALALSERKVVYGFG